MPTLPIEVKHRSFSFSVKAVDDEQGLIEAYGSVFDVEDQGGDVVKPGAFTRTIQASKKRVKAGNAKFLALMLWQHDANQPIGGWYDLTENAHGLLCKGRIILSTTLGRDVYELIKAGVINEFSIGYDLPKGGSSYDPSSGVRNLTEIRLWEISPVSFAMCESALLVGVKAMQIKGACGSTTLPLDDRNAAWDGSAAHNRVVEWASNSDGTIDADKMKQAFFWYDSSEADKIGSYKLIFADVISGKLTAVPKGIYGCAGALQGARGTGVDIPSEDEDAVKKRIETWYAKMAKKFDDDSIVAPWKDDGKARNRRMQMKTFAEHYAEEMCEDLLSDLCSVWFVAFLKSVVDAFKIGDQPSDDISAALDGFKAQFMKTWVGQAVECNLSEYLASDDQDSPLNTSYGGYGYMSSSLQRSMKLLKAGRAISAANQDAIDEHVKSVKSMAVKARNAMANHVQAMHDAVDTMTGGMDDGDNEKSLWRKAGRAISAANAQMMHDHADKAMDIMQEHTKAVTSAANDFANTMQGAEKPAYGDGEGEADDDEQEGKSRRRPYHKGTPATHERPHTSTALEDIEIPASWIKELHAI